MEGEFNYSANRQGEGVEALSKLGTSSADEIEQLFAPGHDERGWFVFHSRPRCEKKAAGTCLDIGLRHYLPLRKSIGQSGKRNYSFDVPLLPGYLFGCCDRDERLRLLRSGYLVRTIDVVDQERLLEELANIHRAAAIGVDLVLYPMLKRGQYVRIVRGPLSGVTGRVSKRKESFRIVLNVTILNTAVAAELDMGDVELL